MSKNRVAKNQYYATCNHSATRPDTIKKHITLIDADPTSFSKLSRIMTETRFSNVFVVMEDEEEANYVLKNIALIDTKMRIVLVNQWDNDALGKELENTTIVHADALIAAHLYDQLPNVPLVAQNVGLGRGEIMEVHIPFGSSYAYRHIGSIVQRKWKIAALYRDDKQILPTNATMIKPNDTLLILGKPLVLDGVYKTINKRMGLFPEPFGKDIYLILDFRHDNENTLQYLEQAIYLLGKLEKKSLFVRVLYPNDFAMLDTLKQYESDNVTIAICYDNDNIAQLIEFDIDEYNIGLIMSSIPSFEADALKQTLYNLKKLVYLFGTKPIQDIEKVVILMSENEKMESISTTAFDIAESLSLKMLLGDFDPEGDFTHRKMIIEHYETLTHIFNMEIQIEQRVSNPIRELAAMDNILQIAPFEERLSSGGFKKLISSKVQDFILTVDKHPKLLVPFALTEG